MLSISSSFLCLKSVPYVEEVLLLSSVESQEKSVVGKLILALISILVCFIYFSHKRVLKVDSFKVD